MSKFFVAIIMAVCGVWLTGCAAESAPRSRLWPQDATVISEINAAARMTFQEGRTESLSDIASRSQLSAAVQVHLVRTAMSSLVFDSSRQQVLLALIRNPYFVREGKQAVLEHVGEFAFEGSRQTLLQAIHRRGTLPTEAEMKALWQTRSALPASLGIETELTVEFQASYGAGL